MKRVKAVCKPRLPCQVLIHIQKCGSFSRPPCSFQVKFAANLMDQGGDCSENRNLCSSGLVYNTLQYVSVKQFVAELILDVLLETVKPLPSQGNLHATLPVHDVAVAVDSRGSVSRLECPWPSSKCSCIARYPKTKDVPSRFHKKIEEIS